MNGRVLAIQGINTGLLQIINIITIPLSNIVVQSTYFIQVVGFAVGFPYYELPVEDIFVAHFVLRGGFQHSNRLNRN